MSGPSLKQLRGQAESAYRTGKGAPRFTCDFCHRSGQTLRHITACARRYRKAAQS